MWKTIYAHRLTTDLLSSDKQETLESMKAWEDRSSCHCIPKNLNIVWHVDTQSRAAATLPHCPLCFSLYISPEKCNSLDAVPPVSFTTGQESWYNEST